jgi:ParB/RepB/Spo0J family partition protein
MPISQAKRILLDIPIERIDRNPENPRIFFRQQELDELTESIRKHGVQVPIAVYKEGHRYVLIDGERRWRCSLKLNRKTIPALVQDKPDALTNLVWMFNIHALREQWDLLTMALKLPRVIDLYKENNGIEPNEAQLSEQTSLSRSIIRRCRLLMNLPPHHIDLLRAELKKPKNEQRISEDFYIEMERALTTVSRSMPDLIPDGVEREHVRQSLLEKYQNKIIKNLIDLRKIARMARASKVNADASLAQKELEKLFKRPTYTIEQAYERSVSEAYLERNIKNSIESLIDELNDIGQDSIDDALMGLLENLAEIVRRILRRQA